MQEQWASQDFERHGLAVPFSTVLLTPRFRNSAHVVFLLLPAGGVEPVLVAKLPRLPGPSAALEREAAVLRSLWALRAGGFETVPRVIAFAPHADRQILLETALCGRQLDPATLRRDPQRCCEAVINWLVEIEQAAPPPASTTSHWFERLIEDRLAGLKATFPLSNEESERLDRTRALVAPLCEAGLPLVLEHGDLSHPNMLLLPDGRLGVLDWELAELQGLPATDLFFFLDYAARARAKARNARAALAAFDAAFFDRAAWARPHVADYAERLGLSSELLTPLFIAGWLRSLTSLLGRLGGPGQRGLPAGEEPAREEMVGAETAAWLRASRYYTLWKHAVDHADRLRWERVAGLTGEG